MSYFGSLLVTANALYYCSYFGGASLGFGTNIAAQSAATASVQKSAVARVAVGSQSSCTFAPTKQAAPHCTIAASSSASLAPRVAHSFSCAPSGQSAVTCDAISGQPPFASTVTGSSSATSSVRVTHAPAIVCSGQSTVVGRMTKSGILVGTSAAVSSLVASIGTDQGLPPLDFTNPAAITSNFSSPLATSSFLIS